MSAKNEILNLTELNIASKNDDTSKEIIEGRFYKLFDDNDCEVEELLVTIDDDRIEVYANISCGPRQGLIEELSIKHNGQNYVDSDSVSNGAVVTRQILQTENNLAVIEEDISVGEYCDDECDAAIDITFIQFTDKNHKQAIAGAHNTFLERKDKYITEKLSELTDKFNAYSEEGREETVKESLKKLYEMVGAEIYEAAAREASDDLARSISPA
ncbi:hypothetical protein Q9L42_020565 (plasmid) [Methylomarinum sp. Ch1-1]|uniref:Uncharacterized protein n=1 Tax=Methylomarinum roseum TaxID=3067653 RepID=A0AAU7P0D1_9GAMM|nr:hypothetical protein [Methylomarinum sp. Ch1-1]MDP4523313.1 hypothetical protein [Methylomarinum sp. Ch1-1]